MNANKAREFFSAYYEGSMDRAIRQTFERRLNSDSELHAEYKAFEQVTQLFHSVSGIRLGPQKQALVAGRLVAEALSGDASRFDVFARLKHRNFPGGAALRTPALVLGMAWYRLRDMLG